MYIGPLLLGIIIGMGTASGYFLSLPVASGDGEIEYGAPVTVLVAPRAAELPSSNLAVTRKTEPTQLTASDAPIVKSAEPGQQTAALTPQPRPAQQASVQASLEAPVEQAAREPQPGTPQPAEEIEVAAKPGNADASTDDNLSSGQTYFPGLSIGRPPPGLTATKNPEANIVPPRPEPASPEQVTEKATANAPNSTNTVSISPEKQDVNAAGPLIKQADLVLPRRNPRLQKRSR